ncbi:MAG: mechanosensitive ion channel family protein [Phycisphaerales bacterium]
MNTDSWGEYWDQIAPVATTWGIRVLGALVFLIVAWIVAAWIGRTTWRAFERAKLDPTLGRFFSNLAKWGVLVLAGLGCLGIFGIETTSFAAVLAAMGLAIGLAMQGTLGNFSAGVMLLIFRPFKVGQYVTIAGESGTIYEIELFSTTLDTPDNRRLIIPNGSVYGQKIENITYHPRRRADIDVGVEYAADIDQTRAVLEAAANSVEGRLDDPAPQVVLNGLGDSSVNWTVRVWAPTPDFLAVKQATVRAVKIALDDAGIGIPFPQLDVHLDRAGRDAS